MIITSVNNDLVKETAKLLQKKYREETGLFLLEGEKCILEAINSNVVIEKIFVLQNSNLLEKLNPIETTEAVLSKISSTETAPKVIAIAKQQKADWNKDWKKIILLENIKDAGNLGTILRTATAYNFDSVILYGDTVDLYNPKTVRSSVGNLWKIPVISIKNIQELKKIIQDYEKIATLPKANNTVWLKDYTPQEKFVLMFGTEASGLSDELKSYATKNLTIEMSKNVESLNLSISAGIIMYKLSI